MKTLISILMLTWSFSLVRAQNGGSIQHRNPAAPAETAQLDFFLGKWEVRGQDQDPKSPPRARTHAYYILDGFMIQDDYRGLDPTGKVVFRGTSLRTYDPKKGAWSIKWLMANTSGYTDIEARMKDGAFVSTGKGVDGGGEFIERYRYYDIQKSSFKFEMERSYDGGKTWRGLAKSIFTRVE